MATGRIDFKLSQLRRNFPTNTKIRAPRPIQEASMEALSDGKTLQELPTGTGKTALQYAACVSALAVLEEGETVFWVFPTKALVEQAKIEHPAVSAVFGQSEHACPWAAEDFEAEPKKPVTLSELPILYGDAECPRASDVPHFMHRQCPHYVDQETGSTNELGAVPCPYYQQTYEAKSRKGIIACTMSFYIFAKLFARRKSDDSVHQTAYGRAAVLVVDEVHRLAEVIRYTLSYDITDWHLQRAIDLLKRMKAPEHRPLRKFLASLKLIARARKKKPQEEYLLTDDEIKKLMAILEEIDPDVLAPDRIREAVLAGVLNPQQDWREIKTIETLARDIRRYLHTMEFAIAQEDEEGITRRPLNYSCSFYRRELTKEQRVQHKLVLHCHYVAPLIRKRLKAPTTVSFSATIGKPEIFGHETGIKDPFFSAPSTFPVDNRRIYLPDDVDDLSRASDPTGRKKTRTLRQMAVGARRLAGKGIRSLVLVGSNEERAKFMYLAEKEGVEALTYSDDLPAKDAAGRFKGGDYDVLCGCVSLYGVGVDFPKETAGAIWFLRPGYPDPRSAATQFEIQRFGEGHYWSRVVYKVMLEAQQAVGRNIRGPRDKGVCFLMSRGFEKIVYAGLPDWLKLAYRRGWTLNECIDDTLKLLL